MRSGLHIRATSSTHCASRLCLIPLPDDSTSMVGVRLDMKASPHRKNLGNAMLRCGAAAAVSKDLASIVPPPEGRSKRVGALAAFPAELLHYRLFVDRRKCLR